MSLKIVFAGTPYFAIPSLEALLTSHHVCAVYTKPDTPSGRGLKIKYNPVKQFILNYDTSIPLLQPVNLKDSDTQRQLSEFFADVMIVIAYGFILPPPVLSLFKYGCINVHASLLPRWRGAAPIQRALLAGDKKTGVSIMQIDEGLDTGDILHQQTYTIQQDDRAGTVNDALSKIGAKALLEVLHSISFGQLKPQKQNNKLATYAAKITKDEAKINWLESANYIDRQVRAFNPWPIAHTHLDNILLKIWQGNIVSVDSHQHLAGLVVGASEMGIDIATKQGIYRISTLQVPGGKPMPAKEFLNARKDLIIPHKTYLGEILC